ncbi:MAG: hypothetical protein IEMM0008_1918 [bacterium]|nr:MAG: hypothetical protein IEMM0008_1918 [bacterium]
MTNLKENQILKRRLELLNKKPTFTQSDKTFYSLIAQLSEKAQGFFTLVRPETVLMWYKKLIKKFWTFPPNEARRSGRPRTPDKIRQLVLRLKNENIFWGCAKIEGELKKLGIDLSRSTIRRILSHYRKKGELKLGLTWTKFIQSHLDSLYATDFFTLDTLFGKRFYALIIIHLSTRRIVAYNLTTHPTRNFVRQQIIEFSYDLGDRPAYLIHDGDPSFNSINYKDFGIKDIKISPKAPNMNAFAERFIGSIRREAFERQIRHILKEYITYYNKQRPHQGLDQGIPEGYDPPKEGEVIAKPILSGLYHHYERAA